MCIRDSTISEDQETLYLIVYDNPLEAVCVKGLKTPVKRVTVLHSLEELDFTYTGALPWSGIPGTLWIWAQNMQLHPFATVLKVELELSLIHIFSRIVRVSSRLKSWKTKPRLSRLKSES